MAVKFIRESLVRKIRKVKFSVKQKQKKIHKRARKSEWMSYGYSQESDL